MGSPDRSRRLRVVACGCIDYSEALALQEKTAEQVRQGHVNETLILLEHPHVLTLGVSGTRDNILASPEELALRQIQVFRTRRGGDVTYHGLGQLVGYPILRFEPGDRDVRGFVHTLEEILIRTLGDFELGATRREKLTGIWIGERKIASLGIGVSRWVTQHGFALNVNTDLRYFDLIVPCGLAGAMMTSMEQCLGVKVPLEAVMDRLVNHFLQCFHMEVE